MSTWPLLNRNKVDDSHVIVHVRTIAEAEDDKNNTLAQSVIRSPCTSSAFLPYGHSWYHTGRLFLCILEYRSVPSQLALLILTLDIIAHLSGRRTMMKRNINK